MLAKYVLHYEQCYKPVGRNSTLRLQVITFDKLLLISEGSWFRWRMET